MIFLIISCIALLGGLVYAGFRAYYLAGILADAQEYIEQLELTNEYMYSKITESHDIMQQIDRLGAFESEDEAGTTFQLLNQVITDLKEQFNGTTQEEK